MRGLYTVSFFETTVAAASGDYDLFEVDPAADKPIELVACYLGNKSEVGDAAEEMVSFSVTLFTGGTFTSGNGTGATEEPTSPGDATASFAAETDRDDGRDDDRHDPTAAPGHLQHPDRAAAGLPPDMRLRLPGRRERRGRNPAPDRARRRRDALGNPLRQGAGLMRHRVYYWRAHRKGGTRNVNVDFESREIVEHRRDVAEVETRGKAKPSQKALVAAVQKATGDKAVEDRLDGDPRGP